MSDEIKYNHETEKWEGITVEQVKKWEEAYPLVDVVNTLLKRMPCWFRENPRKAKKKRWGRFIVNWLSKQQSQYERTRK